MHAPNSPKHGYLISNRCSNDIREQRDRWQQHVMAKARQWLSVAAETVQPGDE
jgi:hypothetical protein